ncbi:hypothetical protein A374_15683 [Fictibacillus macauensis ZFHKF-1]|uniref:Uncharacterized protein n=1 Tax=Fictibacillus macauensis ZFHKF-1 TaxID=1196324 RepID=I8IXM5_9BACL|nr:hypothetical protein [Fictibacillus macauensis]EIT84241.1 hypothetical protein A374_15683 [Fictibacillus macauensis ZFHKF-1]
MRTTIKATVLIIAFVIIGIIVYYSISYFREKDYVSINTQSPTFLKDKVAAVYFSGTADSTGVGSYTVYIDQKGKTSATKGEAIEAGGIAQGDGMLLREDPDKVEFVGKKNISFSMKEKVYTGYRQAAYLPKEKMFYSLTNKGQEKAGYFSVVRWGNEKKIREQKVPGFYLTYGNDGKDIYVLGEDDHSMNRLIFGKIKLGDRAIYSKIKTIGTIRDYENVNSNMLIKHHLAYFIFYKEDEATMTVVPHVMIYDLQNKKLYGKYQLGTFKVKTDRIEDSFIGYHNNFTIHGNKLYHLTGTSTVFVFDLKSKKPLQSFSLKRKKSTTYEVAGIDFRKDAIYILNKMKNKKEYELASYSYKDGAEKSALPVKGLNNIVDSHASSYDFVMLDHSNK